MPTARPLAAPAFTKPSSRCLTPALLAFAGVAPLCEADGFIEDSSATLSTQNIYFNRDFRDGAGQSKREEWAQGFILDFQSGYTPGPLGVGLDAMGMLGLKLDSSPDRTGTGLLPTHDDGRAADEYSKLGLTAKLKDQFAAKGVKVIALSVDPVDSHLKWIDDINETQNTVVNFPIIADADRKVSELYDLIHPNANDTLTVRSLFVIDPNKKVRLTITYPASTGRNFNEILRVIDSLQLTAKHRVATPADWKQGDDVIIAGSVSDDEAKTIYPNGWKAPKPYLRVVPQPK
ncbi:MAG: OprD family outer membrane porin [Bradyrhizobium sp.]|nr:OprD family outer membrane porin [Bradyrhizobium sp.]